MEHCYFDKCQNFPEFICSCKSNLYLCIDHITSHNDLGFHSIQSLYVKIHPSIKKNIVENMSSTIRNLESAMEFSKEKTEILIKQINEYLETAMKAFNKQKEFYENIIRICNNPRGIKRCDYQMIWRVLNDLGAKDLYKIIDFSGETIINPTLSLINKLINDLGKNINKQAIFNYIQRARDDYSFKESLEFTSKLSLKKLEFATKNSMKIIQELRKSKKSMPKCEKIINFQVDDNEYLGISILFDYSYIDSKISVINSIFSNFLSQELIKKILQTGKNLSGLKSLLPSELENFEINSNIFDIFSFVEATCTLTNTELIQILLKRYEFNDYCSMIKKFFLFGQGEFFHLLFEELIIFKRIYDLDTLFEECIWKSNASQIPERHWNKLSLKADEEFYHLEWDSYLLHYNLDYPLILFFSPSIIYQFQEIFSFIWQLKRIEFILKQNQHKKKNIAKFAYPEIECMIHNMNLLHYKLIIFINTIMFYIMEEIIEFGWKIFTRKISNSLNLEDIEYSIQELLSFLKHQCFINDKLLNENIYKILRLSIKFVDLQHELEGSLILDEDTNDNDYDDIGEILEEISIEFSKELTSLRSILTHSQNKHFYYLNNKLIEIR